MMKSVRHISVAMALVKAQVSFSKKDSAVISIGALQFEGPEWAASCEVDAGTCCTRVCPWLNEKKIAGPY